jgi:hypothetical protein
MAEDTNTQTYKNLSFKIQNFNVKILHTHAVTLIDLSMESRVNEGNITSQHFDVKIL